VLLVPFSDDQVDPSVVARIDPPEATAQHVVSLTQVRALNALVVPEVCAVHVEPFVVA
jgi:hypothetical protein